MNRPFDPFGDFRLRDLHAAHNSAPDTTFFYIGCSLFRNHNNIHLLYTNLICI